MKKIFFKYWKEICSLLFGIVLLIFWTVPHVSLLAYQEQYQLFLFSGDYLLQRLALPGGLADYIAEFFTQFNYLYVVGGFLLSSLLVLLQIQTWRLCSKHGTDELWFPLSFLPSVFVWAYMSDSNVMLSFLVALNLVLLLMSWYDFSLKLWQKIVWIVCATPIAFWLLGPVSFVFLLYVSLGEKSKGLKTVSWCLAALLYGILLIILTSYIIPYPLSRLLCGLNYYRYPEYSPFIQFFIIAFVALLPLLLSLLPLKRIKIVLPAQLVIVVLGSGALIHFVYSGLNTELIEYDYLVRMQQWDKIISKAEKKQPTTPMEVSCVNFALSQQGQLGDRLFEFYQNGEEGLFPTFTRDMTSPVSTGEIFFQLGMVNDACRYFFEAQEAIPNFRKSGRLMMRIIQCNIINGQYAVAKKYLWMLQKSLFYRQWANEQLTMLQNPSSINSDPLYSKLRRYRFSKDFLFSDREMDQMLGLLYTHCYSNRNAFEYLMSYELVQRDMAKFMKYYPLGKYAGYTDHIPYAFQQALLYYWTQSHGSFEGMPWSIDEQWMQSMSTFIQTYMRDKNDESLKIGPLSKTFWSYMLVNKETTDKSKKEMKTIY
nr:beta-carotene 15,15'-monooxygenase [Prevotella sp.]